MLGLSCRQGACQPVAGRLQARQPSRSFACLPFPSLQAIAAARRAGCVVAMTAGDAGVVERHHAELWQAIDQGIDLLFTNASEAAALLRYEPPSAAQRQGLAAAASHLHCATGEQLALRLAPHCSAVVVTDGAAGSYIAALGEIHCQPPVWMESPPVDTCGAGAHTAVVMAWGGHCADGPVCASAAAAIAPHGQHWAAY